MIIYNYIINYIYKYTKLYIKYVYNYIYILVKKLKTDNKSNFNAKINFNITFQNTHNKIMINEIFEKKIHGIRILNIFTYPKLYLYLILLNFCIRSSCTCIFFFSEYPIDHNFFMCISECDINKIYFKTGLFISFLH